MLASNVNSTNNDPTTENESDPITGNGNGSRNPILRQLGNLLRTRQTERTPADGYVEFGSLPEQPVPPSSNRTLGTFAGCFAPVSLSMFSALVFIRVGKSSINC